MSRPPRGTVTRRWDEPKLEIGDTISMEEGLVGVVLARYTRSGGAERRSLYCRAKARSRGTTRAGRTLNAPNVAKGGEVAARACT
jgi:hypothetical protein